MSAPEILTTPPPEPGTSSNPESSEIDVGTPPNLEELQPPRPTVDQVAPIAEKLDAGRGQAQSKIRNDHAAHKSSLRPNKVKDVVETEKSTDLDESTQHNPAEPHENSLMILNTHDTALMALADEHIPSIEKFGEDLQIAITAAWPTRHGNRYEEAHVLMLSWEDDNLGVEQEIRRLKHVFAVLYRFDVQEFKIPSKTPGKATTSRISDFLENDSPSSLLIVYYAGHARLSNQINEPPIWAATDKAGSPTLPCGGVQQLLEEAASDVLLLYDSCHSSHPAINTGGQGVTEVIAACGFETQAPGVGPHSFTNSLIRELEEAFLGPAISVAELHVRIIGSLKNWKPALLRDKDGNLWTDENGRPKFEVYKRRTPVHCFLTNETPYRSIMLAPLPSRLSRAAVSNINGVSPRTGATINSRSDSENASSTELTSLSEPREQDQSLQVLLAIRLDDNYFFDDSGADQGKKLRNWCEWLKALPGGAKEVSVQGVYKSFSTLVLLNMPLLLWNLLPSNNAYSFVGFVQSRNLAHHLLKDGEQVKEDVKIAGQLGDTGRGGQPVDAGARNTSDSSTSEAEIALARNALEMVKNALSQIPKAAQENPDEKGIIKFKDAVGRKFSFPFRFAKTWTGMEDLIRQSFLHVEGLGPHVAEGHYDLIGPHGEIILPSIWEEMIQPGWSITMHMWPMPESTLKPVRPMGPPAGTGSSFSPPKPFPPAPSDTTNIRSEWVRGVPPRPPPNWPQTPPASRPGLVPGSVDPSKPSVEKDKPLVKPIKPSTKKKQKDSHANKPKVDTDLLAGDADRDSGRTPDEKPMKTYSKNSIAYTESLVSDSLVSDEDSKREADRKLINKLVRTRQIYRVGKMNRGKYHLTYQISPKKEGLLLLNEYGRKFIDEVMRAKV